MLHQDIMYRLHRVEPMVNGSLTVESAEPRQDSSTGPRWKMIASTVGNVLVGGLLIGGLLLAPAWLATLISLL